MSLGQGDIHILLTAEDQTSDAFNSATANLTTMTSSSDTTTSALDSQTQQLRDNAKYLGQHTRDTRLFNRQFRESHEAIHAATRAIGSFGTAGVTANRVFLQWNQIQDRVEDNAQRVADAEEKLRLARKKGDPAEIAAAEKNYNRVLKEQGRIMRELPGQYLGMGLMLTSLTDNFYSSLRSFREFQFAVRRQGGIKSIVAGGLESLSNAFGGGGNTIGGQGPLGNNKVGGRWGQGMLSRLMSAKGMAGMAIAGGGMAASLALTNGAEDSNTRAMGVAGSVASGAIGGMMMGGPVGAALMGGLGLITGLASNFHDEFTNLFAGRGFLSNKDAGIDVNVQVSADSSLNVSATAKERTMRYISSD